MKTEKVIRPGVDGQVIIRWRFASDYSTRDEGWAIDDFCFEDLGACTPLGITEVPTNNVALSQNYPNPTNSMTAIEYILPEAGQVSIVLYDLLGQKVAELENNSKGSGLHKLEFNTATLAPGMYVYTLRFNNMQVSKRMTVTH
jgi:hypothetical protein